MPRWITGPLAQCECPSKEWNGEGRSVGNAEKVLKEGVPELVDAVESGCGECG